MLFLTQKVFFNYKKIRSQHRKNKTKQVKLCYTIKSMNVFFKGGTFTHGGKRNILYYYTDLLS